MMKTRSEQKVKRIAVALFLLLCIVPSVGMLFFGPSPANANEVRAPLPRLITADGTLNSSYFSGLADWFDDRFQLRPQLSTAWAKLNAALFRTSVEDSVLLGTEGWLYFADSLPDYTGELLPEETLEQAADNLLELQQYCEAHGMSFLFTVAPNKNSLYPEHMPANLPKGETSNLNRLYELLDEKQVNYVNLHEIFRTQMSRSQSSEAPLYFRTDSHWTNRGAALAADTLLSALGRPSAYFETDFLPSESRTGDLQAMLYPSDPAVEQELSGLTDFCYTARSAPRGGEAIQFTTECSGASGRLFCWRDSFGNALYPFLAENFSEATFCRENPYRVEKLEEGEYDTVLVEIVERNIKWLAQQA